MNKYNLETNRQLLRKFTLDDAQEMFNNLAKVTQTRSGGVKIKINSSVLNHDC